MILKNLILAASLLLTSSFSYATHYFGCHGLTEGFEPVSVTWLTGAAGAMVSDLEVKVGEMEYTFNDSDHQVVGYYFGDQYALVRIMDKNIEKDLFKLKVDFNDPNDRYFKVLEADGSFQKYHLGACE